MARVAASFSTSSKSTASTKSARTSTKSSTVSIKSTRTSTKSHTTSSKSSTTSTKSTTASTKSSTTSIGLSITQILTSTTPRLPSTNSTKVSNNSFCHPNCTGTFAGIALGSLLGVALVVVAFIVAAIIYKRRRQANSIASLPNTRSTTNITHGIENNYESNQIDADASTTANNRNTGTLMPPQTTTHGSPILVSNANSEGPTRNSDHIYAAMGPLAKQNPNPTQGNPSRIYLELISDESDALPAQPSQSPADGEHAYYNVGQMARVDNIEYEIIDCRVQPASSSTSSRLNPRKKGFCVPPKTSTSSGWNKTVIAKYDNVGIGSHT